MSEHQGTNTGVSGSIFAGEHSVFVQNNEQQDDEEDLEDQRRRQEELQNLIANAFDDFEYDDEASRVNSSFESTHRSNISNHQGSGDFSFEKNYKNTSLNSFEQLQVLYQVRVKESQKLIKDLDAVKEQLETERDQWNRKNLLLEAENNRTNLSLKQAQELLVEKTDVNDKLNIEVQTLKEYVENLQSSNEKFKEELLFWKSNSNELEQKLHLMEVGLNKNVSEKQIRSHYDQEINKLQEVLQMTNMNLEKCEQEYHKLETKIREVEIDKQVIIAEKTNIINSITKNLEESQAQNFALMNKLTSLQQEKNQLETELYSKDSTIKQNLSTKNYEEVIVTLREELKRSFEEQNQNREEINKLEKLVQEIKHQKEINNKQLQEKLNHELKEQNRLKEEINKLQHNIKALQEEIGRNNEERTQEKVQNKELKEYNNKLIEENKNLKQNVRTIQEEIKICEENSLKSSASSQTHEYENLKFELSKIEKQIADSLNIKDRYILCEQQCVTLQEKIAELTSKLSESQLTITNLQEKLSLKEEKDNLIEILQKKAEMFEEYMANRDVPTLEKSLNTSFLQTCDNFTQTEYDQQMTIYMRQLLELEKTVENQTKHMKVLYQENKSLKEKIVFDRNSFTELSQIWSEETKKLTKALQQSMEKNEELLKSVEYLKKDNEKKMEHGKKLQGKLEQAMEYIKLLEVTSSRQNNVEIKSKFEALLAVLQARLNRCIDVTNTNITF